MGTRVEQSGEFVPRAGGAGRRHLEDMADSFHRLSPAVEDFQVIIPRGNRTLLLQREFRITLWAYAFGPAFEPDGRCFDVDGTLTITLQSDGSTISGPLTGLLCPHLPVTAHQHAGIISYGNPFVEDDSIAFTGGTGQFAVLSGTASFHTFDAGARFTGTLKGTLTG